jgi:6-phospho-beta-glucosidase
MRLTMIGGGGFRTPLVYAALLRDHEPGRITSVALVDTDEQRLATMARILSVQARSFEDPPVVTTHTDATEGLRGTDYVFSAIRVGGLEGRARDEAIAKEHGVIGQETVGFGGISYALRTLPTAMGIAELVRDVAPQAWVINFTNPAGLVTEAMARVLGTRVIGICDSPIGLARRALAALGLAADGNVEIDYAGLNHLGWLTGMRVDGVDRLPGLLAEPDVIRSFEEGRLFGAEWIQALGALPNEYLHYFTYRREVLASEREASQNRGRYLLEQQTRFWSRALEATDPLAVWEATRLEREATYMATNRDSVGVGERQEDDLVSGGYEGVAIALMRSIAEDRRSRLILNVPNAGVIPFLDDDAVVEIPCLVDAGGAHPLPGARVPAFGRGLVATVKYVERETIEAGLSGSRAAALRALAHHPLIDSARVAGALLDSARAAFPQLSYIR